MKRMIGLLMMVGLMVGVVGCGDDDNPVKSSNENLLVGTWEFEDEDGAGSFTFRSDGTLVSSAEGIELPGGTWSLAGDKLTITFSEAAYREAVLGLLASENIDLSDAQFEEFFDAFMAEEFPDGLSTILTINSITDTELITTDEDGERDVFTRQT